jgi:hypothetical protein
MGARNHAGWLVTVCGIALAAGMQVAPLAAASPMSDWGARALEPAKALRNAMTTLETSGNASNLKGVKAACLQIQASSDDLRALLPAPTEALTAEVSAALSELRTAIRPCLDLGPSGRPGGRQIAPSAHDISTAETHLDKATAHMEAAYAMVVGG